MSRHFPEHRVFHRPRTAGLAVLSGLLIAAACCLSAPAQEIPAAATATNHVLQLDGDGDFVELPADAFKDLQDLTVEAWVKWGSFPNYARVFDFVLKDRRLDLRNFEVKPDLEVTAYSAGNKLSLTSPAALEVGKWVHLAVVAEKDAMKLYLNGALVADQVASVPDKVRSAEFTRLNLLGRGNAMVAYPKNRDFHGQMDEVRVWKTARTQEQIRETMLKQLSGSEPGLAALWNFDDPANPGRDASPNRHDGQLMGNARLGEAVAGKVAATASLSGRITDPAGKPVRGAKVRVMQGGQVMAAVKSGDGGDYFLFFAHNLEPYRVLASLEDLEGAAAESKLVEGANTLDLTLRDMLRIAGTLTGPDGQPRRGVKVEAVKADGKVAAFSVSDAKGKFILRRLSDGEYRLHAAGIELDGADFHFGTYHPPNPDRGHSLIASSVVEEGRWCHAAVVMDSRETRLYFNGTLAAAAPKVSSFTELPADSPAYIGWWNSSFWFKGG